MKKKDVNKPQFKVGDKVVIVESPIPEDVGKVVEIVETEKTQLMVKFEDGYPMWTTYDSIGPVGEDMVNSPNHYKQKGIEVFDIMRAFYGDEAYEHFCLCSAQKYVTRCRLKGKYLEDLKKARKCIDRIVELHESK